jgi:addiction module HigA family antidote
MTLIRSDKLPIKHAGIVFNERILKRHKISQTDAAKHLYMSRKQVSLFVNGKSDVSTALAKKLELSSGITASFWLNIQKNYDLYMARDEVVEAQPMYAFGSI